MAMADTKTPPRPVLPPVYAALNGPSDEAIELAISGSTHTPSK